MEIIADPDARTLLEFMQKNLPTSKLIAISSQLPEIARLLWSDYPQQPCNIIQLGIPKPVQRCPSPQDASESFPGRSGADGGSGVVAACQ